MLVFYPQMQQNILSNFAQYAGAGIIPAFANNYIQRPPHLMPSDTGARQGYVEELHNASPAIKPEPQWNSPCNSTPSIPANTKIETPTSPTSGSTEFNFKTEVDTLMKAIQAKTTLVEEASSPKSGEKHYQCTVENCTKSFTRKQNLKTHERSHTEKKLYSCKEPGCGRSFSQPDTLKKHKLRHTGDRPYECEICGKGFFRRIDVRAHKVVHDKSKPYVCRLDECSKRFAQLGGLKAHQNKFHIDTIRHLTSKFASIKDRDSVDPAEKGAWEYFANLYKNSNKGIKGGGKGRKVAVTSRASHSGSGDASFVQISDEDAPLAFGERF